MNKRDARKQAKENTRTVGDLRALINASRGRGGQSKVNPIFSLEATLDIYERALSQHDGETVLTGAYVDLNRRVKVTGNGMLITNILRDANQGPPK